MTSKLTWTAKRGTTRADSDRGGYRITWAAITGQRGLYWYNAWAPDRHIQSGTMEACKDACEAHYAKTIASSNNTQQALL